MIVKKKNEEKQEKEMNEKISDDFTRHEKGFSFLKIILIHLIGNGYGLV
jgi:hypothetical protein